MGAYKELERQLKAEREIERKENMPIFKRREKMYNEIPGPRVGDWVREPDGRMTRITHIWPDHVQTGGAKYGQYYMGDGYIAYSGSLDDGFKKHRLKSLGYKRDGKIWFFKNDYRTADNAVDYMMKFRVYEVI